MEPDGYLWGVFDDLLEEHVESHIAPVIGTYPSPHTRHRLRGICFCDPGLRVCPAGIMVVHHGRKEDRYYDTDEWGEEEVAGHAHDYEPPPLEDIQGDNVEPFDWP